jgi:hypothetical protein
MENEQITIEKMYETTRNSYTENKVEFKKFENRFSLSELEKIYDEWY